MTIIVVNIVENWGFLTFVTFHYATDVTNPGGKYVGWHLSLDSAQVCISPKATWMGKVIEVKSWNQLSCPLLNSIIGPLSKMMPTCTLPGYIATMSLIKHIWVVLDTCVCQQVPVPHNGLQLLVALLEKWDNILQATTDNLVMSMGRRCIALMMDTHYWSLRTWNMDAFVFFLSLLQDFYFDIDAKVEYQSQRSMLTLNPGPPSSV